MNERMFRTFVSRKTVKRYMENEGNIELELLELGPTFIISKKDYSEKAGRIYGNPIVWPTIMKTRQRPPSDEEGFRLWLWNLVRAEPKGGPGFYKIVRTQVRGESRGWHPICLCYVDADYIIIHKRYSEVRGIPGLPASRDLWFKRPSGRSKFSKYRRRFG